MMKDSSDQQLVSQLKEGSLNALGELYNRHRHMVYQTALAITGDREVASDLLQDVFLRMHRFVDLIDETRPLEPWLYRMTANLTYTWIKRQRRGWRILEEVAERFVTGARRKSPYELTEERDEWDQVLQAVSTLPLSQRIVVVMYYLNDLTIQEISETLDIPAGTVKSRLHYGRRALQNTLLLRSFTEKSRLSSLTYESS